ncbi:VCBS repeat-containing protein, partial [Pseudomonadales bacterium]|nr:VCBS repeat-containing protein [Pseudomonadales bacterium]
MSTLLLISFLSMLSFAANAEEYFEEVDSGIALKYSEFKAHSSIAVEDIDVNSDGKLDLVFHFWSGLSGLSSELLDSPPPDFLKIYVQSETGGFEDKTQEILGEIKPSLGGASRHVVKGDFNNDGKEDLAYAINYEDARLVDDPADLSAQLAALLSTASGYEIRFFGTPSWYHSLGVGADEEGRSFVTGNGFSGNFQAELWRFDESNNALAVNADGLEVPPNAFEFLTQSTEVGTDLLLRNANYPDMFGIYAYQRMDESWTLVDQINNPYEGLGSVSILGWNATGYGDASVVDINGYASLEGGGSSYAESCSIRLRPDDKPVALFKVSSAYVPTFGEVDSITSEDTVIFNSLVGFGFENNKITKNILRIENEDPFINANFFDCADVDGDGYDDIAMYPYGQNPLVYINDQKGKFYKLDAARIPSVKDPTNWYYGEYGPLSSLLRDLTGDGVPDLLFWPANGIPDNNFGNEFGEYLDIKMFKGINRLTKNSVDSDGDSISDENEARLGLDPLSVDSDADGTSDPLDAFPLDSSESSDADNDTIGDNADAFPLNASESVDTDGDGIGNNADLDDDNDGFTDEEELADGTNPLSRFSCKSGCFSFDVDENLEAQPLTDGLLVIRHL